MYRAYLFKFSHLQTEKATGNLKDYLYGKIYGDSPHPRFTHEETEAQRG